MPRDYPRNQGEFEDRFSQEHLDYYLDEFTFRFNRRESQSRGKLFYRLAQLAVALGLVPYRHLVGGSDTKPQHLGVT